jgi:hypothetical protein
VGEKKKKEISGEWKGKREERDRETETEREWVK